MVKSELIEVLAGRTDITTAQAEEIINIFFNGITDSLTQEGRVEIRGFGAFTVRKYRAYEGRNPKTGEKISVPEKKLPFWKTGLELRQRVDGLGS
jgi:integration host factor subunit beta